MKIYIARYLNLITDEGYNTLIEAKTNREADEKAYKIEKDNEEVLFFIESYPLVINESNIKFFKFCS